MIGIIPKASVASVHIIALIPHIKPAFSYFYEGFAIAPVADALIQMLVGYDYQLASYS